MKKRDENRNPIYPGWWPDDHVTEATNRARGMPKPKAKQRVGPRLSYSLKGANENENILRMLINSPFWESKQINTECLLESLYCFSNVNGKKLEINSFLSNNIRYKLIWKDFKIELF